MMNKTYYIVGGVNGVGKSTFIKWIEFDKKVDVSLASLNWFDWFN